MAGQRSGNDNDRYVQPNKERGGWDVVKELHKQASAHTETKEEAINRARRYRLGCRRHPIRLRALWR